MKTKHRNAVTYLDTAASEICRAMERIVGDKNLNPQYDELIALRQRLLRIASEIEKSQ